MSQTPPQSADTPRKLLLVVGLALFVLFFIILQGLGLGIRAVFISVALSLLGVVLTHFWIRSFDPSRRFLRLATIGFCSLVTVYVLEDAVIRNFLINDFARPLTYRYIHGLTDLSSLNPIDTRSSPFNYAIVIPLFLLTVLAMILAHVRSPTGPSALPFITRLFVRLLRREQQEQVVVDVHADDLIELRLHETNVPAIVLATFDEYRHFARAIAEHAPSPTFMLWTLHGSPLEQGDVDATHLTEQDRVFRDATCTKYRVVILSKPEHLTTLCEDTTRRSAFETCVTSTGGVLLYTVDELVFEHLNAFTWPCIPRAIDFGYVERTLANRAMAHIYFNSTFAASEHTAARLKREPVLFYPGHVRLNHLAEELEQLKSDVRFGQELKTLAIDSVYRDRLFFDNLNAETARRVLSDALTRGVNRVRADGSVG